MNLKISQQHTPKKAELRFPKDSLAPQRGHVWSGGLSASEHDADQLVCRDEPNFEPGKGSMEEAKRQTGVMESIANRLKNSDSERLIPFLDIDEREGISETVSTPEAGHRTPHGKESYPEQVHATVAPFPKRAEARTQVGSSKQATRTKDTEPAQKSNARRLSSTRPTRNPPPVIKAESLERSPWTGQRPEDRLTDLVIKNGYFEKAQVHNEANTAKPSLWPHLKNGSGIHNLSTLFAAVLQRKEEQGRVIAPSAFKPPPRVTLTDTKREAWIHDLASPSVPLRRLSRTIPHGIRGKLLLDQCLAKQIPMTRAVWLARCVGANELRAFRRKGVSGTVMVDNELRWTREWTSVVESFNQECVEARSNPAWKIRISYAMQLTCRFYFAGLLDRDHFFDWLLANIEHYAWDVFPVALLFARTYWRELISCLKYGRRLTTACCTRLADLMQSPDRDLFSAITDRLQHLIHMMVVSNPSCVIASSTWSCIRDTLDTNLPGDQVTRLAIRSISKRNARLSRRSSQKSASDLTGASAIIEILDTATTPFSYENLSSLCLSRCSVLQEAVTALIRWSASLYRTNNHSIYLAAGIIRTWKSDGLSVENCILQALSIVRNGYGLCFRALSQLIAELIRSNQFDPGRYLRWLIASGALNKASANAERLSCDVEILLGLPQRSLSSSLANLRQMLLRGVGIRTGGASEHLEAAKRLIDELLSRCDPQIEQELSQFSDLRRSLHNLNLAEMSALSDDIRDRVGSLFSSSLSDVACVASHKNSQMISIMAQLTLYQSIFESMKDFWAFSNLSQAAIQFADVNLLTSITCSIARNLEVLDAIGVARPLWLGIQQRYRVMRLTGPPLKPVATSLLQVAMRMSADTDTIRHFEAEIVLCDASFQVTAYTPMSDMQLDMLQNPYIELEESIERLAANSTTMDARVVDQMFEAVLSWVEQSDRTSRSEVLVIKPYVTRLRSYSGKLFDSLASEWIIARIIESKADSLAETIITLVNAGCITVAGVYQSLNERLGLAKADAGDVQMLAIKFLAMLLLYPHVIETEDFGWLPFCRDQSQLMLRCLRRALCPPLSHAENDKAMYLGAIFSCQALVSSIQRLLLVDPTLLYQELELSTLANNDFALANMKVLVHKVVDPTGELCLSVSSNDKNIHKLFETVDDLSLPSYQLGLCVLSSTSGLDQAFITDAILSAAKVAMSRDCALCARLISVLDKNLTREIRVFAETTIFKQCYRISAAPNGRHEFNTDEKDILEKHLDIIEATMPSTSEGREPSLSQMIMKALNFLIRHITSKEYSCTQSSKTEDTLQMRIRVLIRFSLIHDRSFDSSDSKVSFIRALCNMLLARSSQLTSESREYIFDVVGHFGADLNSRELTTLQDALGPLAQSPPMRFLFGFCPAQNAWLQLGSALPSSFLVPESQQPQSTAVHQAPTQSHQQQTETVVPFPLRQWELLPDSTPNVGANDTALSLRLFGARKI